MLVFDAVSGAQKAIAFGLGPVMAALLGRLTGIGGGMTRDVLLGEVPTVLRSDIYAVAALAGAAVVVIGDIFQVPASASMAVGIVLCFDSASWRSIVAGGFLPRPVGHTPNRGSRWMAAEDGGTRPADRTGIFR